MSRLLRYNNPRLALPHAGRKRGLQARVILTEIMNRFN